MKFDLHIETDEAGGQRGQIAEYVVVVVFSQGFQLRNMCNFKITNEKKNQSN